MPQTEHHALKTPDPVTAMGLCIGPVHRMVWAPGEATDAQAHARRLLDQQLPIAWERGGDDRRIASLVNLWLTLTTGDDPLRSAWSIEEQWPGPLGKALRGVLDVKAKEPILMALRRPWRFARARVALTALTRSHPHFRSNPAPAIFHEAREDALALLRAARHPQTPPPAHLDLLQKSPEAWASETRSGQQLLPGVKVWKTLTEWLRKLQAAARQVVDTWTDRTVQRTVLPPRHREALSGLAPGHRALAEAVLADLDLQEAHDQPTPALLRPTTALAMMSKAMRDAPWSARVTWLPISEEAVAEAPQAVTPLWAQQAQAQRHHLLEEIDVLRQRATRKAATLPGEDAQPLWEAVELLDEARVQLHHHQATDAQEWVQLAQQAMATAMRSEKLAQEEQRVLTLWNRLREAGLLPRELSNQPEAGQGEWDEMARAVEAQWRIVQDRFQQRLQGLQHKAHWLHDAPRKLRVRRMLEVASTALQDGALTRAASAMDRVHEQLTAARRDLEHDMEPSLRALWLRAKACGPSDDALHALESQLLRTSHRAQVGLPHAMRRQALSDWVVAAENDTLDTLPLLARVADGAITPLMWWDTLIPCNAHTPPAAPAEDLRDGLVILRQGEATSLPGDRYHFAPVASDEAPGFRLAGDHVEGPYGDDGRPSHPQGLVARLPVDAFEDWFGLLELEGSRWIIERPTLAQLLDRGAELVDRLDADEQASWLDGLLTDLSPIDPTVVARAIDRLRAMELPPHIMEERLERLSVLHGASRHLAQARGAAVRAWLHSDEGETTLHEAARQHVAEHPELWDDALRQRHEQMERELDQMQTRHQGLQEAAEQARKAAEAAEQVVDDARFQLISRWWSERDHTGGSTTTALAHEPVPTSVWPEPALHAPSTLQGVAEDLGRSTHLSSIEAANLLACLLVGRATVVVGPPGSGKTTFLERPLQRLGLAPDRPETLRIPGGDHTRDDLLGILDAQQGLFRPGRLGLSSHLAMAEAHHGATWLPLWFEDLHLGLHGATWRQLVERTGMSLYAPALRPSNRGAVPPTLPVADSICLMGTATLDADRPLPDALVTDAWCIERRPELADLLRPFRDAPPEARPLDLRWLRQLTVEAPSVSSRPLHAPLRLLFEAGLQGLPGHRAMNEVRAWLAVAQTMMPQAEACDLAFVQRVLPPLKGFGPAARDGLQKVREACLAEGWNRSAARLERIVTQGTDMGDAFVGLPA